jgi:hypothetical protein
VEKTNKFKINKYIHKDKLKQALSSAKCKDNLVREDMFQELEEDLGV